MKYKKSLLILIIAIFLVSIASVCASDMENGTIQSSDDITNDIVVLEADSGNGDTEIISSELNGADDNGTAVSSQLGSEDDDAIVSVEENSQDLLAAGEKHSFSELQDLINNAGEGSEITLNYDYSLAAGGSTINIAKGLTINGNKHILDGANLNRMFNVCFYSGVPLVLKNIVFKNGGQSPQRGEYETERGGAILFTLPSTYQEVYGIKPSMNLINCTFTGNSVSDAGGAIYSEVDLTITGCEFSNNVVGDIGNGGAIWCGGKITADNSIFRSNVVEHCFTTADALKLGPDIWAKAALYYGYRGTQGSLPPTGGAIFCKKTSEFNNCDFSNNQVGQDHEMGSGGGAIHCLGNIEVHNSNFVSNRACDQFGGAILCNGRGDIYDSKFSNNVANSGGAISCFASANIYRSEFENNGHEKGTTWTEDQSFSFILGNIPVIGDFLDLAMDFLDFLEVDIDFLQVNSLSVGGAVEAGDIYAKDCIFSRNDVSEHGGALHGINVDVRDCTFDSNRAARSDNVVMEALQWQGATRSGGAVHADKDLTIKNSVFSNNFAASEGGAASCGRVCDVSSSTFKRNIAYAKGGAIYAKSISKVTNSIFDGNSATKFSGDGGAIYISANSNPQIISCEFISNEAYNKGGAIFIDTDTTNLKVSDSKFNKNTANVAGGAIASKGSVSISGSEFQSNEADGEDTLKSALGGAIYSEKDVSVSNSKFLKNSAVNQGGAIYTKAKVKTDNCEFSSNSAYDGGAIYASVINDNIYKTSFTKNFARGDGGAIFIKDDSYPKIESCVFEGNTATKRSGADPDFKPRGGAIYAPKGHIKVTRSTFKDNSANYGGAILTGTVTEISNSKFMNNEAKTNDGGAVYVEDSCTFTISSSTFEGNAAKKKGAAVYGTKTSLRLQSSTFTLNSAEDGGAIYTNKIIDYPSNLVFTYNQAFNGDGGAIYIRGSCNVEFTRCTFEGNIAQNGNGGGIYFNPTGANTDSRVKLAGCSFIGNLATKDGGGLYGEEVSYIQNSVFEYNRADTGNGGAVYLRVNIINDILHSTFIHNEAASYGGAIWAEKASPKSIQYCDFYENAAATAGAVYLGKVNSISNSNFIENHAAMSTKSDGGAVYIKDKCDCSILSCRFEGNYASKRGGAIYTEHSYGSLRVAYCTFVNNNAYGANYGGYKGHSIFNMGNYKDLYGFWMGSNNPDMSEQFAKDYQTGSDKVFYPEFYLKLGMDISNEHPVAGNPYKVYLFLYPELPAGVAMSVDYQSPHAIASFYGDEGFVSSIVNNNETTEFSSAVVVFNSGQGKIYGKLNNQVLSKTLQTTEKYPCSVNITYCDDAQYPGAFSVGYEIEHMANAIYEIRDSQGVIVKTGNLTDPNAADIGGLLPGTYSITVINPESYYYLRGSANATFRIYKGDIEELRVVVQDQTSTEAIKGLVYSSVDGEYNLTVAGTTTVVTVKDHIAYFNLGALPNGDYEAVISFENHEIYAPFSNSTPFVVSDEVTLFEININPGEVNYGQNFVISNRLPEGATGTIKYYLLDGTYIGQANAGENITLQQYIIGPKIIVAIYSGDANFPSESDIAYLLVNPDFTPFEARVKYWWQDDGSELFGGEGFVYPFDPTDIELGMKIAYFISDGATGTITYYLDGTQVAQLPVGELYNIPNLSIGLHTYVLNYSGDENFDSDSFNLYVNMKPNDAQFGIYLTGDNVDGESGSYKIVQGDAIELWRGSSDYPTSTKATVYIDNVQFCQLLAEGHTTFPLLSPGRHYLYAYFPGDSKNPKCYDACFVDVQTNHTDMELEIANAVIDYGETTVITSILPENATGTIDYYVMDQYYPDEDSLNESSQVEYFTDEIFIGRVNVGENFTLPILDGGNRIILAKYSGDRFYMNSAARTYLTINRIEPIFEVEASESEFDYGDSVYISHVLDDVATGTIEYYLGDGTYLGEAPANETFILPKINAGYHEIVAWYLGDRNFTIATHSIYVNVKPTSRFEFSIVGNETNYGEIATICPVLPDDATGTIAYYLSNGTYLGEASVNENFTLPKLAAGTHEIVANYSGDLNYLAASCNANTIVNKTTIFEVDIDGEVNYGETALVRSVLPDDATGTIAYYLSNGTYLGEASVNENFTLPKFDVGTYVIVANYSGDANFNSASDSVQLTVNKVPSIVEFGIEFEEGSVGSAYVSFVDAVGVEAHVLGQPNAVVKVAGNSISVSGLDEGTYILSITTMPDANHNSATSYTSITVNKKSDAGKSNTSTDTNKVVKKVTPKLTAKKKTFKRSVKVKKYTITLKTNLNKALKNAKVTLKVKGKTYKAKTNSKGKATFKITKLTKKGTYKAVITYKGNNLYNKVTKKVKITIK